MITYLQGDATFPVGNGFKYIMHCCNDVGKWGKGFVLSLNKRWPSCKDDYLNWYNKISSYNGYLKLGDALFSHVEYDIIVCHIIGQRDVRSRNNQCPVRYGALEEGFNKILSEIKFRVQHGYCFLGVGHPIYPFNASIHCPRIGCGLAGGNWNNVEELIKKVIPDTIPVFVYDL